VTIFSASALVRAGCAGIGTDPHTPLPPLMTTAVSLDILSALSGYFAAISAKDGPTSLAVALWQLMQSLLVMRLIPSGTLAAGALFFTSVAVSEDEVVVVVVVVVVFSEVVSLQEIVKAIKPAAAKKMIFFNVVCFIW
jgi:hypothetical protein